MYSRNRSTRLLPGAQRAPVGGRVHQAGVGQRVDPRRQRPVHLARLHHLVAQQRGVRLARRPLPAGQDRLAGGAVPDEPGQPQVGGAGDDPFLAGRQEQPRPADGDHVVHDVQQLAGPADRVPLHRGDPQLLGRRALPAGDPAVDLVHVAEVAHQVEQEVDPPEVQAGEVDARPEHAHAGVARVLDHAAADHADLDLRVEQDQVDRGARSGRASGRPRRSGAAGCVSSRIAGPAAAGDSHRAEVHRAGGPQLVQVLERLGHGAQHRLRPGAGPAAGSASTCRDQQALGELDRPPCRPAARALGRPSRRGVGTRPGTAAAAASQSSSTRSGRVRPLGQRRRTGRPRASGRNASRAPSITPVIACRAERSSAVPCRGRGQPAEEVLPAGQERADLPDSGRQRSVSGRGRRRPGGDIGCGQPGPLEQPGRKGRGGHPLIITAGWR